MNEDLLKKFLKLLFYIIMIILAIFICLDINMYIYGSLSITIYHFLNILITVIYLKNDKPEKGYKYYVREVILNSFLLIVFLVVFIISITKK